MQVSGSCHRESSEGIYMKLVEFGHLPVYTPLIKEGVDCC